MRVLSIIVGVDECEVKHSFMLGKSLLSHLSQGTRRGLIVAQPALNNTSKYITLINIFIFLTEEKKKKKQHFKNAFPYLNQFYHAAHVVKHVDTIFCSIKNVARIAQLFQYFIRYVLGWIM